MELLEMWTTIGRSTLLAVVSLTWMPSVAQAEACDRASLARAYGYVGEAPLPKAMALSYGQAVVVQGDVQGPGQSHAVRLAAGDVLSLSETAGDCVGVALRDPSGKVLLKMFDQRQAQVAVDSAGVYQVILIGYAGAGGRNTFNLRLLRDKSGLSPEEREALALLKGKYIWDLHKSPLAKKFVQRAVGPRWDDLAKGFATMSGFAVVAGRLVGSGCEAHECGSAGSFLTVDLSSGRTTAVRMTSPNGRPQVRVVVGSLDGWPDAVRSLYGEWTP
jgi:hypothetical protein